MNLHIWMEHRAIPMWGHVWQKPFCIVFWHVFPEWCPYYKRMAPMCYFTQSSLLKPSATWMMRATFPGLLQTALYMVPLRFHEMRCPYTCMMGEMMQWLVYRPSRSVEYGEDVKGLPSVVLCPVIVGFPWNTETMYTGWPMTLFLEISVLGSCL